MFYRRIVRPLLFKLDPERAHHMALRGLGLGGAVGPTRGFLRMIYDRRPPELAQRIWGLRFPNPVGLAAGFDKNGRVIHGLEQLGFGFLEIGGVTARPQQGNEEPRIFRLKDDRAIINRMGLPNDGAEAVAKSVAGRGKGRVPLFCNIAKATGAGDDAASMAADVGETLATMLPHVDGVTVNVSCPNTADASAFKKSEALVELLTRLADTRASIDLTDKPMILKVSPDMDDAERDGVILCIERGLAEGLCVANTTLGRPASLTSPEGVIAERGGLSGKPLFERTVALVGTLHAALADTPIIGVGGIATPEDARAVLDAGARLVEVYTAFVYEGPSLPSRLVTGLDASGWRPSV